MALQLEDVIRKLVALNLADIYNLLNSQIKFRANFISYDNNVDLSNGH